MVRKKTAKWKFVDLSIPIESVPSDPEFMIPQLEYIDHRAGLASAQELLGCRPEDLPLGLGWAAAHPAARAFLRAAVDAARLTPFLRAEPLGPSMARVSRSRAQGGE